MEAEAKLDEHRNLAERVRRRASQYPEGSIAQVLIVESEMLQAANSEKRAGWRYPTYQDLVLDLGTGIQTAVPIPPPDLPAMEPRRCYANSYELATEHGFTYVEGFALGTLFPVAHAWVVDEAGTIYDPTWASLPSGALQPHRTAHYVGVQFDTDFLMMVTLETEYWSIFGGDWTNDNLCLRRGLIMKNDKAIARGEA